MSAKKFSGRSLLWGAATAALASAGAAQAQESAPEAEDNFELEEVTVTAQKRAESLQDVPVAVTAVSADTIKNSHVSNLSDVQFLAPTVQFTGGSAPSYQVRGVGTNTFDFAIENSVGVQVDGIPQLLPRSTFLNSLVDVARIEVLRGPQGTLFGKNSSAGLMTITTGVPELGEFSNTFRASYGSKEEIDASNILNLPIGENVAWRTSLSYREREGYIRNLFTGDDIYARTDKSVNTKLHWRINDNLNMMLVGDYQDHEDDGYYVWTIRSVGNPLTAGNPPIQYVPLNFVSQSVTAYGIPVGPDNLAGAWNSPIYNNTKTKGAALHVNYTLGSYDLVSITGWRDGEYDGSMDSDSTPYPFYEQNLFLLDGKQLTQELRLQSPTDGRFQYVLGAFFSRFQVDAQTLQTGTFGIVPATQPIRVTSSALGGVSDFHVDNKNYALFGQGTISFGDDFRLIVGARVTQDDVDSTFQVLPVTGICQRTFATTGNCYSTPLAPLVGLTPSETGWSGKLGAQYDFSEDSMGYLTVSRGYKGVSVNNVNGASTIVEPETSTNYEVGLKTELFDRRLGVNVAVYRTDYEDFQAQTLLVINGINQYSIGNAGGLRAQGVETEFAWRATEALTLTGSAIYSDAEFTDFITQCYPLQTVAQGCVTPPGAPARFQAAGYPLNNAPKWTFTAGANLSMPLGASLRFLGGFNAAHKGDVYYQVGNPATIQEAYTVVNANIGIGAADERWQVSAFGRNLFDEQFVSLINPLVGTVGGYHNRPAENAERTYGVSFEWRFGSP